MTTKQKRQAGFTLIEMSIVMAIVSVLVASALGAYKVQVAKQYRDVTTERIKKIQDALATYRMQHDRIPCPSPISTAPNATGFGVEMGNGSTSNCFNNITATGVSVVTNAASNPINTSGVPAPKAIYIGGVPVKTLNLPIEVAFDSWGRRFRYAVSAGLTSYDTTNHPFNPQNGVINVIDEANQPVGPANGSPFIVISSGKDGAGGVTYDGKSTSLACPALSTRQGKNCSTSNNGTFMIAQYAENSNASTRFDDYAANTFGSASNGGAENIDGLTDGISDWPATGNSATNVFLGYNSGGTSDVPSGTVTNGRNTGVGVSSLQKTSTGTSNTAIGYQALMENTTGANNASVGRGALSVNTSGKQNAALGSLALSANTTGDDNVGIGYAALQNTTSGSNTAVGSAAMKNNTTGGSNTAIGYQAMSASTTASGNTALGWWAMSNADSLSQSIGLGIYALQNVTGGNQLIGIGTSALNKNSTGLYNIGIGFVSLGDTTTGSSNVAVGLQAGYHNSTGSNNTGVGTMALSGDGAGSSGATGNNNSVLGYAALARNTTGNDNTAIGNRAMLMNTTGNNNIAMGSNALTNNVSGTGNVAIGTNAMITSQIGLNNVAIGTNAQFAMQGEDNIAIGTNALTGSAGWGWQNIAIGTNALQTLQPNSSVPTGMGNIAIGTNSGPLLQSGGNTLLGTAALHDTTGANNGDNTAIGSGALNMGVAHYRDTALGAGAGAFSGWGGGNSVFIGYSAGYPYLNPNPTPSCTWGSLQPGGAYNSFNNVIIGSCATVGSDWNLGPSNDIYNAVSIGSNAIAADMAVAIGGRFTRSPTTPNTGVTLAERAGSIAIGAGAQSHGDQTIVIGANSQASGNNTIAIGTALNDNETLVGGNTVIGNTGATVRTYIRGSRVYLGNIAGTPSWNDGCTSAILTTPPCNGSGAIVLAAKFVRPSDVRLKKDILDLDAGLDFIEKLRPVSYIFKNDKESQTNYGFIAQEVEKLVGEKNSMVVHGEKSSDFLSLNYTDLIAPVVKAVQELAAKVEKLAHDVADVVAQLNPLKKTVSEQQARIEALEKTVAEMKAEIKAMKAK